MQNDASIDSPQTTTETSLGSDISLPIPYHFNQSFKDQICKELLTKIITKGIFSQTPKAAQRVIQTLEEISARSLDDKQAIEMLTQTLADPIIAAEVAQSFSYDETARIKRRVDQITQLSALNTPPKSFLDIGCGNGAITAELADRWHVLPQQAVCLEVYQRRQPSQKYTHKIFDGITLPATDNSVEFVSALMVLHHEEDPLQLLTEIKRVLAPNGMLFIRDHDANTDSRKLLYHVIDKLYFNVLHNHEELPTPGNYRSLKDWQQLALQVGLESESVHHPEPDNPNNPFHLILKKSSS